MAVYNPVQIDPISLAEIMQQLIQANGNNDDFFYLRLSTKSITNERISKQELKELRNNFYEQLNQSLSDNQWRKVKSFSMTYFSRKEQDETAEEHQQRVLGYKDTIQQLTEELNLNEVLQISSFLSKPCLHGNLFQSEDGNGDARLDYEESAEGTQRAHEASLGDHVSSEDSDNSDSESSMTNDVQ